MANRSKIEREIMQAMIDRELAPDAPWRKEFARRPGDTSSARLARGMAAPIATSRGRLRRDAARLVSSRKGGVTGWLMRKLFKI